MYAHQTYLSLPQVASSSTIGKLPSMLKNVWRDRVFHLPLLQVCATSMCHRGRLTLTSYYHIGILGCNRPIIMIRLLPTWILNRAAKKLKPTLTATYLPLSIRSKLYLLNGIALLPSSSILIHVFNFYFIFTLWIYTRVCNNKLIQLILIFNIKHS